MSKQNNTEKNSTNNILSSLATLFVIILGFGSCLYSNSSNKSSKHIEINHHYQIIEGGVVGFSSKDSLEKYVQLCLQNDKPAHRSYLITHIATGDAVMLSSGETVTVSDISPLSGMAKVRKTGSSSEFWVYTGWLE